MDKLELIASYFPDLSTEKMNLFRQLAEGYREWNPKVNLVSRADLDNLEERHILHSLAVALVFRFEPMTEIMDLGTGGGFPGLPLAVLYPECNFLLVDSIGKKIKVVEDLAGRLNLRNVRAVNGRAENVQESFDFVVTRAVAPAENLVNWTRGKFVRHFNHSLRNGILAWKGGDLSGELGAIASRKPVVFHLKDYLKEEFFSTKQIVHIPMAG